MGSGPSGYRGLSISRSRSLTHAPVEILQLGDLLNSGGNLIQGDDEPPDVGKDRIDGASLDGAGNTYRFAGVIGDAFTLTLERGQSAGVAWLNGVQIVVPPPAPKVPALGGPGVWALVSGVLALGVLRARSRARRGTRPRS